MKRFGLLLCSCVMAISTVFAAVGLNASKKVAVAETTTPTPQGTAIGTLGSDGLYSTSMTQIAPVNGVASGVDNVYFEGFGESTFFLTEFTGKNAPNFAVRATNVYETWNGEAAADAGLVFSASAEKAANVYEAETIAVSNGFKTSSRYSSSNWEPYQTKEEGKGPGLDYLSDDQTYVMILGAYGNGNGNVVCWGEHYLFTLSEGVLELVNHSSGSFYVAAAAGDKAVIYPSIGADTTKEISFKYSAPATSVGSLVESLGVSYKQQLAEEIGGGLTLASLNRVEVTAARDFTATNVEYIELDMASSEMGTTTWILTDFVGANAPNMAFGATGGFSTWTNGHTNDQNGVGMLWAQTYYHPSNTNHNTKLFTGFTWNAKATGEYSFTTLQNQTKNQRYIQIIGATIVDGNDTLVIKTYKVSAGELSLFSEETLSGSATNYNHGKLVLYGNMNDKACGGSCTYALYNPSGVSFKYSQPAATVEELIQGLDKKYEYRTQLAETLGVTVGSVTIKNEAGEEVSSKTMVGDYTLPQSETKGVIGYEYNGELYHAGNVLNVSSDIVVTEVTLDFEMSAGASIRAKEAKGYYGGLRFETTVSSAKMEKWADNIALYGMVIATDNIEGDFDIGEANSETTALINYVGGEVKNKYYITLTDVKYYNYNLEFSARAYAQITYKDGTTANFLTDYSEENNSRSVYEVAQAALTDTEYGYSTEQIDFIEDYVQYTVDLTADANGDLTLLDADTMTYEAVKNNDGTYTITVKAVPAHIANAGYIPVTVWETVDGALVAIRYVAQATLTDGNLVATFTVGE